MAAAVASLAWWGGGGHSRGGGRTYLLATASAQGKPPCHLTSAPGARPSPLPPPCSRLALLSLSLMAPSAPWPPPTHLPPSRKLPVPRPPLHCAQGSFSGPCGPARSPALPSEGVPHTASPTERLRAGHARCGGCAGSPASCPQARPPTWAGGCSWALPQAFMLKGGVARSPGLPQGPWDSAAPTSPGGGCAHRHSHRGGGRSQLRSSRVEPACLPRTSCPSGASTCADSGGPGDPWVALCCQTEAGAGDLGAPGPLCAPPGPGARRGLGQGSCPPEHPWVTVCEVGRNTTLSWGWVR